MRLAYADPPYLGCWKRWLSDREYVIDNPSPTDEGGEGA